MCYRRATRLTERQGNPAIKEFSSNLSIISYAAMESAQAAENQKRLVQQQERQYTPKE